MNNYGTPCYFYFNRLFGEVSTAVRNFENAYGCHFVSKFHSLGSPILFCPLSKSIAYQAGQVAYTAILWTLNFYASFVLGLFIEN